MRRGQVTGGSRLRLRLLGDASHDSVLGEKAEVGGRSVLGSERWEDVSGVALFWENRGLRARWCPVQVSVGGIPP